MHTHKVVCLKNATHERVVVLSASDEDARTVSNDAECKPIAVLTERQGVDAIGFEIVSAIKTGDGFIAAQVCGIGEEDEIGDAHQ